MQDIAKGRMKVNSKTSKKRDSLVINKDIISFCTLCKRVWEKGNTPGIIRYAKDSLPTFKLQRKICEYCEDKNETKK